MPPGADESGDKHMDCSELRYGTFQLLHNVRTGHTNDGFLARQIRHVL